MSKKPTDILTGQERNALRVQLVTVHGLTNGQATSIVNANSRADIVSKMILLCKTFPKGE